MNVATRMSLPEVPFLKLLPPPAAPDKRLPSRPSPAPARLSFEEPARQLAASLVLESMASQVSPRHWGINE